MKVREVLVESTDTSDLATALEFLRNRSHNKRLKPESSVPAIVNLVHNLGGNESFTADDLKYLVNNDPTIQNLVKSIDDKGIVSLQPFGDEIDAGADAKSPATDGGDGKAKDPQKTVAAMTKKAAAKREG